MHGLLRVRAARQRLQQRLVGGARRRPEASSGRVAEETPSQTMATTAGEPSGSAVEDTANASSLRWWRRPRSLTAATRPAPAPGGRARAAGRARSARSSRPGRPGRRGRPRRPSGPRAGVAKVGRTRIGAASPREAAARRAGTRPVPRTPERTPARRASRRRPAATGPGSCAGTAAAGGAAGGDGGCPSRSNRTPGLSGRPTRRPSMSVGRTTARVCPRCPTSGATGQSAAAAAEGGPRRGPVRRRPWGRRPVGPGRPTGRTRTRRRSGHPTPGAPRSWGSAASRGICDITTPTSGGGSGWPAPPVRSSPRPAGRAGPAPGTSAPGRSAAPARPGRCRAARSRGPLARRGTLATGEYPVEGACPVPRWTNCSRRSASRPSPSSASTWAAPRPSGRPAAVPCADRSRSRCRADRTAATRAAV